MHTSQIQYLSQLYMQGFQLSLFAKLSSYVYKFKYGHFLREFQAEKHFFWEALGLKLISAIHCKAARASTN